ncbi:LacI family DNA-binding transcriptional regulator [Actinopolymorpha singaporensis]|uniref:Transcriptional regulator, LacI family n=1 Tax=Actinopolymorpha singaporensis TaxID=117157 RepID=A0A1H1USY6_9ACTN|nr:LacI family DNA-binding transcriptional regulator [Actinopolymorpha singaporensis]SDS75593.1 transcriptional regulator, LacI family [Actinopolymorpha singaporensis]
MTGRPTIHDVARHAGVAVKTVSRVLNSERAVSESMRARVQASIQALDYRPNSAARVLRKHVTRSIGYVCEDISEPVQARLARAIERVASQHESTLTVSLTHHDPGLEQGVIESLLSRQVDGLLLWPTGVGSRFLQRLSSTVPVVCVDRPIDGVETDTVFCDNRRGVGDLVDFLVRRGHRRIGFVGDPADLFTQQERFEGYRAALARRDLKDDPSIVFRQEQDVDQLRKQLHYWRSSPAPPTALVAASSLSATTLVRALPSADPIEVAGFDDFPLADVIRGGITVVMQDIEEIGRAAAETLFRRLTSHNAGFTHTRVSSTLIDRSDEAGASSSNAGDR